MIPVPNFGGPVAPVGSVQRTKLGRLGTRVLGLLMLTLVGQAADIGIFQRKTLSAVLGRAWRRPAITVGVASYEPASASATARFSRQLDMLLAPRPVMRALRCLVIQNEFLKSVWCAVPIVQLSDRKEPKPCPSLSTAPEV